jgi:hypothetical protein
LNNTDSFAIDDGSGYTTLNDITVIRNKSGDGSGIDVQDSTAGDIAKPINVWNFHIKDSEGTGISSTDYSFVTFSGGLIENAGSFGCYPKGKLGTRQRYVHLTIIGSVQEGCKMGASAIGAPTGIEIVNNLFINNIGTNIGRDVDLTTATVNHNHYVGGPGFTSNHVGSACDAIYPTPCTFAQWQAEGMDANSTDGVDPLIVGGTGTGKYRLRSNSPARCAGVEYNLGSHAVFGGHASYCSSIGAFGASSGDEAIARTARQ